MSASDFDKLFAIHDEVNSRLTKVTQERNDALVNVLELRTELSRVTALINTPEILDFGKAVQLEAAHQRERWGAEGDVGKTDADWFWLIGYLAGKALGTDVKDADSRDKKLHRIITVAAAACNWHAAKLGKTNMRPGIEAPAGEATS